MRTTQNTSIPPRKAKCGGITLVAYMSYMKPTHCWPCLSVHKSRMLPPRFLSSNSTSSEKHANPVWANPFYLKMQYVWVCSYFSASQGRAVQKYRQTYQDYAAFFHLPRRPKTGASTSDELAIPITLLHDFQ